MIDTDVGHIRRQLDAFRARYAVPAMGAAVVGSDGAVLIDVVGTRRRDRPEAAAPTDRWHIGSCAKALTAALYARLVQLGAARWGTPVRELFPDLAARIDPEWSRSTIDDLLVCRAGVRPNLSRAQMRFAWADRRPVRDQRSDAVTSALASPPHRRGVFRYSNLGYVVAGAAIDRLAGIPFEDALQAHLLSPLGVSSAGFGPPPGIWGHRARVELGGLATGSGPAVNPADPRSDYPEVLTPAGRLHLALGDWATLQRVFLVGGGDLLTPESLRRLLSIPDGRRSMAMGWASAARIGGASLGMQGSNRRWAASAIINDRRDRVSMVVTNDGRTRVLAQSAMLAARLLTAT